MIAKKKKALDVSRMTNAELGAAGLAILDEIHARLDRGEVYAGVHIDGDPGVAASVFGDYLAYDPRTFLRFLSGEHAGAIRRIRVDIMNVEVEGIAVGFAKVMANELVCAGRRASYMTLLSMGFPSFAHFISWFSKPYDELRGHCTMWLRFISFLKVVIAGTECSRAAPELARYHELSDSERAMARLKWDVQISAHDIDALGEEAGHAIIENVYRAVKMYGFGFGQ